MTESSPATLTQPEPQRISSPNTPPKGTSRWIVLLLLIFFPPLAWYFMWKESKYHSWFPILLMLYGLLVLGVSLLVLLFVVPQLYKLYDSLDIQRPKTTYLYYVLPALGVFQILFGLYLRGKEILNGLSKKQLLLAILVLSLELIVAPFLYTAVSLLTVKHVYDITSKFSKEPESQISPSPSTDPTANWKVYTNEKYGFSVKYPPFIFDSLENKNYSPNELSIFLSKRKGMSDFLEEHNEQGPSLKITVDQTPESANYYSDLKATENPVSLNNNVFYLDYENKILPTPTTPPGKIRMPPVGGPGTYYFINGVVERGNRYYIFHFRLITGDLISQEEEAVFKQILSTFKFTDQKQVVDTSYWETYVDNQKGFSIKHPQDISVDKEGYFSKKVDLNKDFRSRDYQFKIYLQEKKIEYFSTCCENVIINNTNGYKEIVSKDEYRHIQYYLRSNNPNKTFDLRIYIYSKDVPEEDIAIFEKMIQTFQLLE